MYNYTKYGSFLHNNGVENVAKICTLGDLLPQNNTE